MHRLRSLAFFFFLLHTLIYTFDWTMYSLILHNKHKPHLTDMEVNQTNTNQTVRNRHCDLTFFFFFKNTLLNVNKALMWLHKAERESKDCVCAKKKRKKKKGTRSDVKSVERSVCFFCCVSTQCSLAALVVPSQAEDTGRASRCVGKPMLLFLR